ncbi:thioredoxin family protein [Pseudoalteromonas sp. T1lg65]|uniref:thioredoxin family protein n=1 Tax=Pseudoalteromonas sp. T1lg65 TaxID=2077101 RepID=UPI003F79EFBB
MNTAVFYHAGCSVCTSAEQLVLSALDKGRYQVAVIHLGEQASAIAQARKAGVTSVPALVLDGEVFHINYGASLDDVEGAQ